MTNNDRYSIDHDERIVSFVTESSAAVVQLRVPEVVGDIKSAERRGDFVVVMTEHGRVSYHGPGHPLAGRIHWHSIRKLIRERCLLPALRGRVDFHVTHFPYASGGRSASGAYGRISIDKQAVFELHAAAQSRAWELGAALAEYLLQAPQTAVGADNVIIASVALVDRRLTDADFARVDRRRFDHPLWNALGALRSSLRQNRP